MLYDRVIVPLEVDEEIHAIGIDAPGVAAFDRATWLERLEEPAAMTPYLRNSLDRGEASVIQSALDLQIPLVCIDESVGRRVARLSGLTLTGSIGVLIKARNGGEHRFRRHQEPDQFYDRDDARVVLIRGRRLVRERPRLCRARRPLPMRPGRDGTRTASRAPGRAPLPESRG